MWPDWVSNPGPLTYESGALLTVLRGPAACTKQGGKSENGRVTECPTCGDPDKTAPKEQSDLDLGLHRIGAVCP